MIWTETMMVRRVSKVKIKREYASSDIGTRIKLLLMIRILDITKTYFLLYL